MVSLVLTLVGPDRPGLVSLLSERVAAGGGSWLESRMARLEGQFAGIVSLSLPEAAVPALRAALEALTAEGFQAVLRGGDEAAVPAEARSLELELVCLDRPGIVRDITEVLAARGVNIEELTTRVRSGSFSGEAMFQAEARLRLPPALAPAELRAALEILGAELMVDIRIGPSEGL
jgi:glycine cleavage system regulatory protein